MGAVCSDEISVLFDLSEYFVACCVRLQMLNPYAIHFLWTEVGVMLMHFINESSITTSLLTNLAADPCYGLSFL